VRTIAAAIASLILLGPIGADAQDSRTICNRNGDFTNCSTTTSPAYQGGGAVAGFAQGFNESIERQGGFAAIRERHRERREEHDRQARYAKAGKLINDGKCPEARSFALTSSDLDLAQRVAGLCPAQPPAP